MDEARARGFSVATKCATVDELIEKFRDRVDEDSILVTTHESREVGSEFAFALLLADKKAALSGTCIVRDVYTDVNNPFMRRGIRLGIKSLGPESEQVFAKLVAKRVKPRRVSGASTVIAVPRPDEPVRAKPLPLSAPKPPPAARAKTQAPPALAMSRTTTNRDAARRLPSAVQIPPRAAELPVRTPRATPFEVEAEGSDVPVERRTPGSPFILPANPLTDIPDENLEGFVEDRTLINTVAPDPFPAGTDDQPLDDPDEDEDEAGTTQLPLRKPATLPLRPSPVVLHAQGIVQDQRFDEPMPLPPPPAAPSNLPVRLLRPAARAPTIDIVRATELAHAPPTSRWTLQLLLRIAVVVLIGGAPVILYLLTR